MTTRLLMISALVVFTPALAAAQTPPPAVVVAQGQGVVKVAPDQAWVTVAVETRDTRAPEARRLAAVAMTTVLGALKSTGVPAEAIRTTGFSLNPDYEYVSGRQRMRGFIVRNEVQVRIDDIAKVADVLDAVGGITLPPSSTLSVQNLRFDLKERDALTRQALGKAVADAMANAAALASGAGASVGRIVRIDQGGRSQPIDMPQPMMAMAARDMQPSTPISPSEIEIHVFVSVTVELR